MALSSESLKVFAVSKGQINMTTQQTFHASWNEVIGKVRQHWGEICSDDLQSIRGNVEELIALIQRKTGETREHIERVLEEMAASAASSLGRMAESAKDRAHQASERIHEASENAVDTVRRGYSEAESLVQSRPAQSVLVAFGLGLFAGAAIGWAIRRKL
jgi:ElaB/YqjD/DUF883 family membrane-anchored ribosome-binding protein